MVLIRHPLLLLTFAVAALAAWPWSDSAPTPPSPSPPRAMGSDKANMVSGKIHGAGQKQSARRAAATSTRKQRKQPKPAVPLNPTHGHHPAASHEWHKISGAKTTYKILRPGHKGTTYIKGGDKVTMHATGKVQDTGKKFWSTRDEGHKAFTYVQGAGVIRAWDSGTRGMRVGERRQLRIPAAEAYGADGFTHWNIPPNKDLEFELEVMKIKSKPTEL